VAGFFVAAALIRALVGRRIALGAAIPAAVALLFAVLAVPAVWGGLRAADSVRDGLVRAPGISEREKCLTDGGHGDVVGLSRFVVARVPPDARLAVHGPVPQVCLQLSLLPREMVRDSQPHEFTLYTGADIPVGVRERPGAEPYEGSAVLVREG
jgi:hypothetical protein